ncbi:MAG: carbon-nitrogen family hydrolase [Phycisphaerales bacterium]|nr:MAG: carbon-nitrogen family hydrolase [Phycisphaerales bacterium]
MRAHLVQTDIVWEDKPENRRRAASMLHGVEIDAGDLIVLPEMFDTGFSLNVDQTHDEGDGARWLSDLARSHKACVVGGLTVRDEIGMGRNRALCVGHNGETLAQYEKLHPFSYGREGERFVGGERIVVFPWKYAEGAPPLLVQPTVCYDLRFPELYRAGRRAGAELILVIANWPSARTSHWRALLVARAIENQAYVIGVNRCGSDPHLAYDGASMVVGPRGETLCDAGESEGVHSVAIDAPSVRAWREEFPAWRDARTDLLPHQGRDGRVRLDTIAGTPRDTP